VKEVNFVVKMCAHHMKFVAKTVLVRNNDVEAAYRALDRLIILRIAGFSYPNDVTTKHCKGPSKVISDCHGPETAKDHVFISV